MPRFPLSESSWAELSTMIANSIGLHFPPDRKSDVIRAISEAAPSLGFSDVGACIDHLLSCEASPEQIQTLADYLTIGETYFFRERKTFDVLANDILPELIHSRRGRNQRLRLWSAGCCTGEEAYSMAMTVRQCIPDVEDWHITILATDINRTFLRKAVAGSYSEYSFRDSSAELKERYFKQAADGSYSIDQGIKNMVSFSHLNLIHDAYPSLTNDTNAMDIILCRNVLMYLTPQHTANIIDKFHRTLRHGGYLAVSPCESSQTLFPQFLTRNSPEVILFQKDDAAVAAQRSAVLIEPIETNTIDRWPEQRPPYAPEFEFAVTAVPVADIESQTTSESAQESSLELASSLYREGKLREAVESLLQLCEAGIHSPAVYSMLARSLANLGQLADAILWCDRWIESDKFAAAAYYLRGVIMVERGDHDHAGQSLQRVLYLQPDFVLAYFALGNIARHNEKHHAASKHFEHALYLLNRLSANFILPESDGLMAGRLAEIVTALATMETSISSSP